ncbi:STAS domain-containing protein [Streptomyces spectabilis]|uniref:Anti-sigma factor antagonist n=1 Tax=Streptomyces spectabilis TaxID=68270 RepID=A0A516RH94_STRST|nr:STAS domain-containing protein [Streptomyces spectabilis]QDQ15032.1 STAS domain-containing protein [Streptomyces spectabilis]
MEDRFWLGREDDEGARDNGRPQDDGAGARAVLRLSGELDLEGAPSLAEAAGPLLRDGSRTLVLDCHGVTFCDSSGLNTLLNLRERAAASGARLLLARPSASVLHLLRLTHTERVFHVVDAAEAADDASAPRA